MLRLTSTIFLSLAAAPIIFLSFYLLYPSISGGLEPIFDPKSSPRIGSCSTDYIKG